MPYKPLSEIVNLAPHPWPTKVALEPGDLSLFAPMGLGLGAPMVLFPWDKPESLASRGNYYGFQERGTHPIKDAPRSNPCGGLVYFDNNLTKKQFDTLLKVLEVYAQAEKFLVFAQESEDPNEDGYLTQARVMSISALGMFGAAGGEEFSAQTISLGEFLWRFMENERARWGTGMSGKLEGLFGGDGDWARESLCFGFMVENSYQAIFRIWSRAWLVTK